MKALIGLMIGLLAVPCVLRAQEAPAGEKLGFGNEGLPVLEAELQNVTSPRTVQLLGDAMKRAPAAAYRVKFVRDLGECQIPEALRYLQEAMTDADPLVRAEAARSIARIKDPAAAPTLRKLLDDSAATVRAAAITSGASLGDPAFVDKGLQDPDAGVLSAALEAASTPQHADAIASRVADLPTASLKLRALAALGRIGSAANGQVIAAQIGIKQPAVTAAAVQALGRTKAAAQANVVLDALKHEHPTVRREAMLALPGVTDAKTQQQRAIEGLEDTDPSVRQAAATVLQGVPTPQAVSPLVAQLSHEYQPLHDAAREALVAAGSDAIPSAEKLLSHADPRRREDGSYILGKLKSDAGFEQHVKLLEDKDWPVVEQAARSLGAIGRADAAEELAAVAAHAPRMFEVLKEQGSDQSSQIVLAADEAITEAILAAARLGYRPVLEPLLPIIPMRDGASGKHRAATIWAYGLLTETPDPKVIGRFPAIYGDMYESLDVKFEAVKAYGNLTHKPARGFLEGVIKQPESPELGWVANWARNRITGENQIYTPAPSQFRADVSISDTTEP